MNNKLLINYLILSTFFFIGCRENVSKKNKNDASASYLSLHAGNEKYAVINTKESVVLWKGSSLLGTNSHTGFIYISNGELVIKDGQLTGGTAEIDMNTIEDETHSRDNRLVNHLKDPDFFDVKKFPFSAIVITNVVSTNGGNKKITGNLTIKGVTHPVSFPAKIEVKNEVVTLGGKLVIDRTKWDVRYKSARFYDLVADQSISDSIEFEIKIVAKK